MSICDGCLETVEYRIEDNGSMLCQKCFGQRYNGKRDCNMGRCETPTMLNLKDKWEFKNGI